jgi:phosphoadenosine phosphosulfate reductase
VKSIDGALFVSNNGESIQVYATGTVVARSKDKDSVSELMSKAEKSVRRGMLCVGCGVCIGACPINAITKESHRIMVSEDCTACGKCIDICPLVKFQRKE